MPVNSDSVSCSPLFEIRESQNPNASINQYGNGERAATAAKNNNMPHIPGTQPGPPFHISSVTKINLEPQNPAPFVPSQSGPQLVPSNFNLSADNNEMDISPDTASVDQPSPATTTNSQSQQSRGGSTSHSSYSPGQGIEHLPYRPSPRMSNRVPLPHTTSPNNTTNTNANFFPPSDDMFSAYVTGNPGSMNGADNGFLMGPEWELAGMGPGTGMTPMSDGGWNQLLESVNLGWDGMGPPHDAPPGR